MTHGVRQSQLRNECGNARGAKRHGFRSHVDHIRTKTTGRQPWLCRWCAAARPVIPAPMTATVLLTV